MAIGLRFAGSANARAEALLRQHVAWMLNAKKAVPAGVGPGGVALGRLDKQARHANIT